MKESIPNALRRDFLKGAAAVGLVGAADAVSALRDPANAALQDATAGEDQFQRPPGLVNTLDLRFPVAYQTSIPAAVKVVTDYFSALSQRDLKGMAEMCHFPFATFEGPTVVVVNSADDLMARPPASMGTSLHPERWSDHDSYLQPGCYDIFGGMEVFNSNPVCANLSLDYYRYDDRGKILLRCQGIYIVTNNDGKWGIEVMSTIFTPGDLIGRRYPDAEEAGMRARIVHDIGPNTNDSDADQYDYQYGPNVGLNIGGGGMFGILRPNEDPMATFKTKGVKSRLRISEIKPEAIDADARLNIVQSGGKIDNPADVDKYKNDWGWYRKMFRSAGIGEIGIVMGVLPNTRVVHAGVDKAHTLTGITRYTCSGERFNTGAEIDIVTWINGRWACASGAGRVTMQDCVNDIRNQQKA